MAWLRDNPRRQDAFRRGDKAALAAVYDEHVRLVEFVARRGFIAGGAHVPGAPEGDVEDLVQECFLRAFGLKARQAYDPSRPYRPYLLQILRNLMVDHARKRGRALSVLSHEPVDLDALPESSEDLAMPGPEDHVYWAQLREAYQDFEAELLDEESDFIRLRYVEERAQRDVATSMSITRRHVRTLETRVRDKLRTFLRRRGL